MAAGKSKKVVKKAKLKLTADQKAQLAEVFGADFVKRIATIQVDQIEGYLKSNVVVN